MTATLHRHHDGHEISRGKNLRVMMSWAKRFWGVSRVELASTRDGGAIAYVFYGGGATYGRIKFADLSVAQAYYNKRSKLSSQPQPRSWFGGCVVHNS